MVTLLVGDDRFTWRQWLKDNPGELLCLDPAQADNGPPCRAFILQDGKIRQWRLIGAIDPLRNPVGMIGAAWQLSAKMGRDVTVQLFSPKESPLLRQMALTIAQGTAPDQVLVPAGSGLASMGWPVGAEEIELPEAYPNLVFESQRRARWLEVIEGATEHVVDLDSVMVEGSWLGNGVKVDLPAWEGWAERTGNVLHLAGHEELTDENASRFLDITHATRIAATSPDEYQGLLCSFSSQEGEDFGMGIVREFLPERRQMRVLSNAVAPAPVRILRLGSLLIDSAGRESGHIDRRHV